jgi:hypothetical protein
MIPVDCAWNLSAPHRIDRLGKMLPQSPVSERALKALGQTGKRIADPRARTCDRPPAA